MSGFRSITLLAVLLLTGAGEALAQGRPAQPQAPINLPPPPAGTSRGENFSDKPPAQLFASDCTGSGCHKGPQGLAQGRGAGTLAGFLRAHYTNSQASASALATYLASVGGSGRPQMQPERPEPAAAPPQRQRGPVRAEEALDPDEPAAVPAPRRRTGQQRPPTEPIIQPEIERPAVPPRPTQQQPRTRPRQQPATTAPVAAPAAAAPEPAAAPVVVAPPAPVVPPPPAAASVPESAPAAAPPRTAPARPQFDIAD